MRCGRRRPRPRWIEVERARAALRRSAAAAASRSCAGRTRASARTEPRRLQAGSAPRAGRVRLRSGSPAGATRSSTWKIVTCRATAGSAVRERRNSDAHGVPPPETASENRPRTRHGIRVTVTDADDQPRREPRRRLRVRPRPRPRAVTTPASRRARRTAARIAESTRFPSSLHRRARRTCEYSAVVRHRRPAILFLDCRHRRPAALPGVGHAAGDSSRAWGKLEAAAAGRGATEPTTPPRVSTPPPTLAVLDLELL